MCRCRVGTWRGEYFNVAAIVSLRGRVARVDVYDLLRFDRVLLLGLGAFHTRRRTRRGGGGRGRRRWRGRLVLVFPLAAPNRRGRGRRRRFLGFGLAHEHRFDAVLALLDGLDERRRLDADFSDFCWHGVAYFFFFLKKHRKRARMKMYGVDECG